MYDCPSKPITLRLPDDFGLGDTTSTLDLDFLPLSGFSPQREYLGVSPPPPSALMADLPGPRYHFQQNSKGLRLLPQRQTDWQAVVSLRKGKGANQS